MRLGDILVSHGVIDRDTLEQHAANASGRLGDYLRAHTNIGGRPIARALAEQQRLEYVELDTNSPDRSLFQPRELSEYILYRYVPYRLSGNCLTVATSEPSDLLRAKLQRRTGFTIAMVVATHRDLNAYLGKAGAAPLTRRARLTLRRHHRGLVASHVLTRQQRMGFVVLLGSLAVAWAFAPGTTWITLLTLCNLFYFTTLAFKLQLYLQGREAQRTHATLQRELDIAATALRDENLPIYTILVPLFREPASVLQHLIRNLNALDYPKEKLDIKLICEADDKATIEALEALHPPGMMDIVRVPPSQPRTKPKAINVAMQQVRGEYAVIYDAEDAPEPNQLKRAIAYFNREGKEVACLQAPLNYYNRDENLLTQLFALEYSTLFHFLLPALERLGLPIPLGGTSNHLKVATLLAMGGWDAFNVTEDADLGMRLAYLNCKTRVLPSLTLEESPIHLGAWMKQRTRWVKGYIQTWLVYMRDPAELRRRLGARGYYGFQFFIGAPALTFLLAPFFWVVFLLSALHLVPIALPPFVMGMCLVSLVGGILSHWLFARAAAAREEWHMPLALLIFPFYWLLHSVASFRAIWQLITAPHYWEKTTHGISRTFNG